MIHTFAGWWVREAEEEIKVGYRVHTPFECFLWPPHFSVGWGFSDQTINYDDTCSLQITHLWWPRFISGYNEWASLSGNCFHSFPPHISLALTYRQESLCNYVHVALLSSRFRRENYAHEWFSFIEIERVRWRGKADLVLFSDGRTRVFRIHRYHPNRQPREWRELCSYIWCIFGVGKSLIVPKYFGDEGLSYLQMCRLVLLLENKYKTASSSSRSRLCQKMYVWETKYPRNILGRNQFQVEHIKLILSYQSNHETQ